VIVIEPVAVAAIEVVVIVDAPWSDAVHSLKAVHTTLAVITLTVSNLC
jgi:hypothetical protein